jgi:Cof subfamily protein (haloacid dehalogenase superfamily)
MIQPPSATVAAAQAQTPMNPQEIQLLVLDIDGTIAGVENDVREPVKQAVQAAQARGIQVAIATGRMYRSALRFHRTLGSTLPLMSYQGALVKDPDTGMIHRHWAVPRQMAIALLDYFEQPEWASLLSVHCYINDQLYIRELTLESKDYAERTGVEPLVVGDLRQALTTEPTKVLAMSEDTAAISHLLATMRQRFTPSELYLTTSVASFFEATHPLVNKGTAVQYLAEEHLGLKPENVMAIGDNFNDLEMIQYAGIGIAMGDAPEGVKAAANWVAPSVEQDGAAAAIEEFLLAI